MSLWQAHGRRWLSVVTNFLIFVKCVYLLWMKLLRNVTTSRESNRGVFIANDYRCPICLPLAEGISFRP